MTDDKILAYEYNECISLFPFIFKTITYKSKDADF